MQTKRCNPSVPMPIGHRFGGIHFNTNNNTVTFEVVGLRNDDIPYQILWTAWKYESLTNLKQRLEYCKFHKHCKVVGFDRYQIDDRFQNMLKHFGNFEALAITPKKRKEMLDMITEHRKKYGATRVYHSSPVNHERKFLFFKNCGNGSVLTPDHIVRTDFSTYGHKKYIQSTNHIRAFSIALYMAILYATRNNNLK